MLSYISTQRGLATITGATILAASVNANVMQTGGYFSSHALLVIALSIGVFAGARVVGSGVAGKIAAVIIVALLAGELYNLSATAERIVVERENGAAPLKAAKEKHDAALQKLREAETSEPGSIRLVLAKQAKEDADKAVEAEARNGGCRRICQLKKVEADKAQAELVAAGAEAQELHGKAIEAAKADVAANPLPASATPFADRLGWAPWVLDLIMAGLLSVGANGLAGVLIGYGAHSTCEETSQVAANDDEQSDFSFEARKVRAMVAGDFPKPTPPTKPRKRGRKADPKIINFTERFREKNGRAPSARDLRSEFPALPVSTAYDYVARARVTG